MSNPSGRAVARPRIGIPSRMKVLVDEQPTGARREPTGAAKESGKVARTALNDLSHPNRIKPVPVAGKENKALEKQLAAAAIVNAVVPTTSATSNTVPPASTRPRSGSHLVGVTHAHIQRPTRPHSTSSAVAATKIPSARYVTRDAPAPPSLARTASGRLRDEEDADPVQRKRLRVPGGGARPAPSFPSSVSGSSSVGAALPSDDLTSELDLEELVEVPEEDYDDETAVPSSAVDSAKSYEEPRTAVEAPRSPSPEPEVPLWWTDASPESEARYAKEIQDIRNTFKDEVDEWDPTMVSEYADEIFEYMADLEAKSMPNPNYIENQNELQWHQRTTLVDWLVQIHTRYHLIPETLWIAVNIIDRFLSKRVVSLIKVQLVGVTAMFIASKYEEIMAPSVDEFVFMTENGYTKDEILKGEKIILQSLNFNISQYCSPYSWVRRISKADDYDIQTRTLSKFLMEVCLLDHRFICARPSMIAAIAMYTSRRMLEGDWNEAFVFYSNYTEQQLEPGFEYLVETIAAAGFGETHVYRKYASKRFLKSSIFARNWTGDRWTNVANTQLTAVA